MAWGLLIDCRERPRFAAFVGGFAMLIAFGAASAALDAVHSLTSSGSSSARSTGFSQASADLFGLSGGASASGNPVAGSGFSRGAQISPDVINTLVDAQSQSSGGSGVQAGSGGLPAPTTSSSAASSTYSAVDQLIQRQQANTIPLAVNPLSVKV